MSSGTDLSGELLDGRFRVESPAGRGRFGAVFHGRDQTRGTACAIRVLTLPVPLPAAGASASEALRMDLRETVLRGHKAGQRVPTIAKTFGFAIPTTAEAVAYVASSWLDGETLAESLDRRRAEGLTGRTASEAVTALSPIAGAVGLIHDLGGVHGALHPQAIRLVTLGRVQEARLLDAGLETVLLAANGGASRGPWHAETDAYLAPELLSPSLGDVSPRADVYALALLVLELLADRPPIPLSGERETRELVLDPLGRPTPGVLQIEVAPVVADVLARAVSLEPLARFRDVGTFWSTLQAAVERGGVVPAPLRVPPPRVNDTIQMSGGSLPSVRSLDALLEAIAVEPPPRESEPPPATDDEPEEPLDPDMAEGEGDPMTPATRHAAPATETGPRRLARSAPPSLSVAPARWSPGSDSELPPVRSRVPLFLGLGVGAALGLALFAYLLASPAAPASSSTGPAVADAGMRTGVTAPSPPPPFDAHAAALALAGLDARLPNCKSAVGPNGRGNVRVTFAPDGTVSAVAIDPPYAGTSRGMCLMGLFHTPRLSPFSGTADAVEHAFSF